MGPFLRLEKSMFKDWRDKYGYYHTPKACCVCDTKEKIGLEPRYGYAVCEQHSSVPPIEISRIIGEKNAKPVT